MPNWRFPAFLASALCALALALTPQPASAEADKAALVIGNGAYAGGHPLPACVQSARDVGGWLQRRGFHVIQVLDASSVDMRKAIGDFVAQVSDAPPKATIIYVCSFAAVANQRLFMVPVDSDPDHPARLETQGVILKALLNTLAGSNGVLFADLGLQPDKNAADAIDLVQAGLPSGVHLALVARRDDGVGALGRSLPGLLSGSGQDWAGLSAAFQAQYGSAGGNRLAVFAPPTGPMPPALEAGGGSAPVLSVAPSTEAVKSAPAIPAPVVPPNVLPPAAGLVQSAPTTSAPVVPTEVPPQAAGPAKVEPAKIGPDRPAPAAPGRAATERGSNPKTMAPPARPVQHARRPDRRASRIQAALARIGFYGGPVNGLLDGRTKRAIRAFQTDIGDAPSGVLTQIQIAKLLNIGR